MKTNRNLRAGVYRRRLAQAWNEERDLHTGTVYALYENAFDVGGLRRARAPDGIWVIAKFRYGSREIREYLFRREDSDVNPRRERSQARGRRRILENNRARFGNGPGGTGDAKSIIIHACSVE